MEKVRNRNPRNHSLEVQKFIEREDLGKSTGMWIEIHSRRKYKKYCGIGSKWEGYLKIQKVDWKWIKISANIKLKYFYQSGERDKVSSLLVTSK